MSKNSLNESLLKPKKRKPRMEEIHPLTKKRFEMTLKKVSRRVKPAEPDKESS